MNHLGLIACQPALPTPCRSTVLGANRQPRAAPIRPTPASLFLLLGTFSMYFVTLAMFPHVFCAIGHHARHLLWHLSGTPSATVSRNRPFGRVLAPHFGRCGTVLAPFTALIYICVPAETGVRCPPLFGCFLVTWQPSWHLFAFLG